jgi:CRISPR-associated exonuclease Cas4
MSQTGDDERASVPISALEHFEYCPRQAALIHIERYFESSLDTVRGDLAHAAINLPGGGTDRRRQRVWRSLPVWSDEFGLHGVCDVVQFDADGPTPVEHKSGTYRPGGPADLQVAAQAVCLRGMFDAPVARGLVFSGRDRQRHEVTIDDALVERVALATAGVRALLTQARLPPAVNDNRCTRCSLRQGCIPDAPTWAGDLYSPRGDSGDWCD